MQHYISNYTKGFRDSSLVVRCALRSGPVAFASMRVAHCTEVSGRAVRCAIVCGLVRGVVMRCAVLSGLVMGCVSGTVGRCAVLSGLVVRCAVVRGLVAQWSLFPDELVRCALCSAR